MALPQFVIYETWTITVSSLGEFTAKILLLDSDGISTMLGRLIFLRNEPDYLITLKRGLRYVINVHRVGIFQDPHSSTPTVVAKCSQGLNMPQLCDDVMIFRFVVLQFNNYCNFLFQEAGYFNRYGSSSWLYISDSFE